MHKVELQINGEKYGGWKDVKIIRGVEQLCAHFDLSLTDKWPGHHTRWQILPGDECVVFVDDKRVITGYVFDVAISFDDESHTIQVSGRDKTADLIDSSIVPNAEWEMLSIAQIAAQVAKPYGINVINDAKADEPIKKVAVEEGESAFELLERLARQQGVLLTTNFFGELVIMKPAVIKIDSQLKEGESILRVDAQFNDSERFNQYIAKGQRPGDDADWGAAVANIQFIAKDTNVRRYRPLVIVAEENSTLKQLERRANWEANVRAARSQKATITVADWYVNKELWLVNRRIQVNSASLGINTQMYISQIEFAINDDGITTKLSVVLPNAFLPEPPTQSAYVGSALFDVDAIEQVRDAR